MNVSSAQISVWALPPSASVKIVGRANVTCATGFKRLLVRLAGMGCTTISLELAGCPLMDSTFLGTLAKFATDHAAPKAGRPAVTFRLVSAGERITDMLDNLCVMHLFTLAACLACPQPHTQEVPADPSITKLDVARTALEAHLSLTSIDPANIPKFKDVLQFFQEHVDELEHQAPPGGEAPKTSA